MKRRTALTPSLHLLKRLAIVHGWLIYWYIYIYIFFDISACLQLLLDHVGIRSSLDHVSVHSVWDGMCTNRSGTNTVLMSKHDDTRLVLHTHTHCGKSWGRVEHLLNKTSEVVEWRTTSFPIHVHAHVQISIIFQHLRSTNTVTKMLIQYHSQETTSTVYIYIHTYIRIPCPYAQSLAYATLALRLLHLQDLLQLRAPAMTNPRRCTDHVTHQGCAILLGRARGMHARISNFWASLRGFWYQ